MAASVARTRGPVTTSIAPAQSLDPVTQWIDKIIQQNTHMNFVDRIARPELYPTLPLDDGTGDFATHKMAWSTYGPAQTPIVYPTIIYDRNKGSLQQLDDDAAFRYAMDNKEFIPFDTPEQADVFSREYKQHWRDGKGPIGY